MLTPLLQLFAPAAQAAIVLGHRDPQFADEANRTCQLQNGKLASCFYDAATVVLQHGVRVVVHLVGSVQSLDRAALALLLLLLLLASIQHNMVCIPALLLLLLPVLPVYCLVPILPWYCLTGDNHPVTIGHSTNLQDGVYVGAMDPASRPTSIGSFVSVGHGAVVQGCTVGDKVLIGMNAVVQEGATVS